MDFLHMRHFCRLFFTTVLLLTCITCYANSEKSNNPSSSSLPWSLEIGLGYGQYLHMARNDGTTVLARMGIAKELLHIQTFRAGMEMGVQSGNTMRLEVPLDTEYQMGGLHMSSTIKPSLDLLLTGKFYSRNRNFFIQIKAGPVWRHWQFVRSAVNDISEVDPEIQLGIGYDINRVASLSLSYQGIFGKNPDFKIVSENYILGDCYARVSGIPGENSIILGLSFSLDEGLKR